MLPSNIGGNILAFRVALIALHCRPDGDSVRMQKNLTAAISYIFVYFLISYFISFLISDVKLLYYFCLLLFGISSWKPYALTTFTNFSTFL